MSAQPETVTIPRELFERLVDAANDRLIYLRETYGDAAYPGLAEDIASARSLAQPPETQP